MYLKNKERQEKDLLKKIHKLGVKLYKKGEVSKMEALSQANYKNALKFLRDYGTVALTEPEDGEGVPTLSLADKGLLEPLRRKLFRFMR